MKICSDCKYLKDQNWCEALGNLLPNRVSGGKEIRWLASSNREDWYIAAFILNTCGMHGKWFQPKPIICKPEELEQALKIQAAPAHSLVEIHKFPYPDKTQWWKIW